jgi:hypothetical protein
MKRIPRLSSSGVLTPPQWESVAKVIESNFREVTLQPGIGYHPKVGSGGTTMSITAVGGSSVPTLLPFDMTIATASSPPNNYEIKVAAGTVNGVVPSNIFTPLDLGVSTLDSVTIYVGLAVTATSGQIQSVTITKSTTTFANQTPTASTPPASFTIPMGLITGGKVYNLLGKYWVNATSSILYSTADPSSGFVTNYYVWTY